MKGGHLAPSHSNLLFSIHIQTSIVAISLIDAERIDISIIPADVERAVRNDRR